MDPLSCKKRRQQRVEVLRRKRQRTGSFSETSSVVSSDDSWISQPCYLTKDDMRRKKNRESAERSRLRKLALIDVLSSQVNGLIDRHQDLKEENFRLRSMAPGGKGPEKTVSAIDQLVLDRSYQFGHERNDMDSDASTLSSSSPQRAPSPTSFSLESSAGMFDNFSVDNSACFFPSSSGSEGHHFLPDQLASSSGQDRAFHMGLNHGPTYVNGDVSVPIPSDMDCAFDALCDLDFGEFFDDITCVF